MRTGRRSRAIAPSHPWSAQMAQGWSTMRASFRCFLLWIRMARQLLWLGLMRDSFVAFIVLPVALSLSACGGTVVSTTGPDLAGEDGSTDAGLDTTADSGACPDGSYPIGCDGVVMYCCPPGANCLPPSCGSPDAGKGTAPDDAGKCPADQYVVIPCCGGYNDTSCSNGPGPPPPFCTALPSSCKGQSGCLLPGSDCEGPVDDSKRTLTCMCI
jgi:hypothetical protein